MAKEGLFSEALRNARQKSGRPDYQADARDGAQMLRDVATFEKGIDMLGEAFYLDEASAYFGLADYFDSLGNAAEAEKARKLAADSVPEETETKAPYGGPQITIGQILNVLKREVEERDANVSKEIGSMGLPAYVARAMENLSMAETFDDGLTQITLAFQLRQGNEVYSALAAYYTSKGLDQMAEAAVNRAK